MLNGDLKQELEELVEVMEGEVELVGRVGCDDK